MNLRGLHRDNTCEQDILEKKNQKCLDENNKISVQFLAGRLGERNLGAIT